MPELLLFSSEPSHLQSLEANPTEGTNDEGITWENVISVEEAQQRLELHFYPFKRVRI